MAFSTAGFMGGLAQLIQGKNQNALADQQAKEKLEERRLQLGLQADQIRKQRIEEDRAAETFAEQKNDWAQKGKLRPLELTSAQTGVDQAKENLAGARTQNTMLSGQLTDFTAQREGRAKLFDVSVATPRMNTVDKLTADLTSLDSTINSQTAIANDVTKPMAEREAAQIAIRNAHNSKYAVFNSAKGKVGIIPNLTYSDLANAAGIRQTDPLKPIDWNTYQNWDSHFPAYTPTPLRKVLAAGPEGIASVKDLIDQIGKTFDPTKHITQPKEFFKVIKTTGADGKTPMLQLDPTTPKFEFDKGRVSSDFFKGASFPGWLKAAAATTRGTEAEVVQQLIGVPLTKSVYAENGKLLEAGDVDAKGNVILSPALRERIAANFAARVPSPENLSTTINNMTGQWNDSARNAISFFNAQITNEGVGKTSRAAELTARLSGVSEVFKSANDGFMKNQDATQKELNNIQAQISAITKSKVSSAAAIFGDELKALADPIAKELGAQYRALYLKKFQATKAYFGALGKYGENLFAEGAGGERIGAYAKEVGTAAQIFNNANVEPTELQRKIMGFGSGPAPAERPNGDPAGAPAAGGMGNNQKNAGLGMKPDTKLGTFKATPQR
tara:strand:- start:6857 stop:8698 length:1842 start_codon:yes stop_codon:yes gene_type:complete